MANGNSGLIFKIKDTEPVEFATMLHSEQIKQFAEKRKRLVRIFLDKELTKPKHDKPMLKSIDLLEFIAYLD